MNQEQFSTTENDHQSGDNRQGNRPTAEELRELAWDEMRTCYDPELPVSIVELGLVYSCEVSALESGGSTIAVELGVTNPGCDMSDMIRDTVVAKLGVLPGVKSVQVEIVLDPPWDQSRLSEAARLQLGLG